MQQLKGIQHEWSMKTMYAFWKGSKYEDAASTFVVDYGYRLKQYSKSHSTYTVVYCDEPMLYRQSEACS